MEPVKEPTAEKEQIQKRQEVFEQKQKLREAERKSRANSRADSDPISDYLVADMTVSGIQTVVEAGVHIAAMGLNSQSKEPSAVSVDSNVPKLTPKETWSGIPDDHIASQPIIPTIPEELSDNGISNVAETIGKATSEYNASVTNILANNAGSSGGIADSISNVASDAVDMAGTVLSGAAEIAGSVASGAVDVAGTVISGAADVAGTVISGTISVVGGIFEGL